MSCNEFKSNEKPWNDRKLLKDLYKGQGLSTREIGDKLGCSGRYVCEKLNEFGIQTRPKGRHRNSQIKIRTEKGYERAQVRPVGGGSPHNIAIHRLAAVAWCGIDELKDSVVHHKNNIPWDNREENISLLSKSEHSKLHADPESARKNMIENEVWKYRENYNE